MKFKNLTIKEIHGFVNKQEKTQELISDLLSDGRKGLIPLANKVKVELEERIRYENLWAMEKKYWADNVMVAGLDEAGRGPLAGPVVAAGVVFKSTPDILGLNDSKKLNDISKDELLKKIQAQAYLYQVSFVDNNIIDKVNILNASKLAMANSVKGLSINPDVLLIDGNFTIGYDKKELPIVKGDSKVGSIAAASILAKVYRDRHMIALHEKYPQYNFAKNKGYPTEEHYWALGKYGPSPVHRTTFKGVLNSFDEGEFTCEE